MLDQKRGPTGQKGVKVIKIRPQNKNGTISSRNFRRRKYEASYLNQHNFKRGRFSGSVSSYDVVGNWGQVARKAKFVTSSCRVGHSAYI